MIMSWYHITFPSPVIKVLNNVVILSRSYIKSDMSWREMIGLMGSKEVAVDSIVFVNEYLAESCTRCTSF
jgi:hypothetical protein